MLLYTCCSLTFICLNSHLWIPSYKFGKRIWGIKSGKLNCSIYSIFLFQLLFWLCLSEIWIPLCSLVARWLHVSYSLTNMVFAPLNIWRIRIKKFKGWQNQYSASSYPVHFYFVAWKGGGLIPSFTWFIIVLENFLGWGNMVLLMKRH